jgi:hypothetical protein
MVEIMPGSKGKVLWVKASGRLTDQDYREVFIPRLEAVIREHGKARLLFHLDPDFQGWELGAMWDDARFGWQHRHDFEKIAVVGGPRWADAVVRLFAPWLEGEVKTMLREQLAEAWEWIQPEVQLTSNYPQND